MRSPIRVRRVYAEPEKQEGQRYLVERLWPRGVRNDALRLEAWLQDVAPSATLRRWYGHEPDKWPEFRKRYVAELRANKAAVAQLKQKIAKRTVTFVFAASDAERNSAVTLKKFLTQRPKKAAARGKTKAVRK